VDQKRGIAALLLAILLTACGGGGGEGESSAPPDPNAPERVGRGSLTIGQPTSASTYSTESDSVVLAGSAFISPTHSRCCSGSADDTGVTVTSSTGSVVSQDASYCQPLGFGPLSLCAHTWQTTLNLPVGDTKITMTARDPSGNIGRDSITITRLPDRTPPQVDSTMPQTGATNVAVNTFIRVSFSERMDEASITAATFLVRDSNGNSVVGTVRAVGTSATFAPASALSGFTTYTATMTTGARDAAGNPLASPHSWTFKTAAVPDTTPPSVVSTSPSDGSSCGADTLISASFSEAINASTVTASTFNVINTSTKAPVTGSVSALGGNSFAFAPSAGLAFATQYRATLTNEIRDLAGNAMLANHTWSFSTAAAGVGTWQPTALGPAPARGLHSAVWTGTEMIVWGGFQSGLGFAEVGNGARYRPNSDAWLPVSDTSAPSPRWSHAAVWTGSEMIVWGGNSGGLNRFDGGRYDPITDTWRPMASTQLVGGIGTKAVWTGSEMLVVGSGGGMGRYNPATDTWAPMSAPPVGVVSSGFSFVWTGRTMIFWGGSAGAAYDPATDTWEVVNPIGAPSPRLGHSGVWTGSEMIIWGGRSQTNAPVSDGSIYDPRTARWRPMSACAAKSGHTAIWTGNEMIVWGGERNTGHRYNVATDSWRQLEVANSPAAVSGHSTVWTGSEMVIWGGGTSGSSEGARYQP
jgi:hypothetical protein